MLLLLYCFSLFAFSLVLILKWFRWACFKKNLSAWVSLMCRIYQIPLKPILSGSTPISSLQWTYYCVSASWCTSQISYKMEMKKRRRKKKCKIGLWGTEEKPHTHGQFIDIHSQFYTIFRSSRCNRERYIVECKITLSSINIQKFNKIW